MRDKFLNSPPVLFPYYLNYYYYIKLFKLLFESSLSGFRDISLAFLVKMFP